MQSKKMMIQKLEKPGILVLVFSLSSVGATFVNKYVLSVLKFTYPTVYQSWQMGFAFIIMMMLSSFGLIQLSSFDRLLFRKWLPAMFVFTIGIYSGSKALSLLPVPIFCVMYNLVYVFITVVDEAFLKQTYSSMALIGLVTSSFGIVFTLKNDIEVNHHSYKWILIHSMCVAFYSLYAKRNNKLPLKELDKILLNSSFSFVALMFLGTLTGEVKKSTDFPFLFYNRFHAGCFLSGLTGSLVCVSYSRLTDIMPVSKIRWINSLSMAIMSLLSIFLFDFTVSTNLALSFVALMFLGTLTGEVKKSTDFPFLFYNRFHAGCLLSGLTGSLVCVSYSRLTDIMPVSKIRWINSLSMAIMSFLSIFLFDFTVSTNLALSVIIGLAGSVLYTYSVFLTELSNDGGSDEKKTSAV